MDVDTEFLCIVGLSVAILALIAKRNRKSRAQRKMWVNPYLQQRAQKGRFHKDVRLILLNFRMHRYCHCGSYVYCFLVW